MNISTYKLFRPSDKKKIIAGTNLALDQNSEEEKSQLNNQILSLSKDFISDNFEDKNQIMINLIELIPKSSEDFQDLLISKFNYFEKLIDIDITEIQQLELELTLKMIYILITLPAFKDNKINIEQVFDFLIFIIQKLIHNYQDDKESTSIQFSLECLIELVNKNNFQNLKSNFFEEIRSICFLTDEISFNCSMLVERISSYVPMILDFKYYFDFFKYMCYNINPVFAYHLYLTLLNIMKRYPNIVKVPTFQQKEHLLTDSHLLSQFWVYNMIIESYRYSHDIQSIAFEICSFLKKDTICILEDENIKMNILTSLTKSENDQRTISAIHALKNFILTDSENCATHYFSMENSKNMSRYLIKHVLESPYGIKEEASYLFCFAMKCAPQFFAKGFIEPYSTGSCIKQSLEFEEDAIINIFCFNKIDLTIFLLQGLIAICIECIKWRVKDELFAKFNSQILPLIKEIESKENEELANCITELIRLLIPEEEE